MTCKQTGGYILSTRLWRMFHEQITKSPFETKLFRPTCVMISYKGFEKKVSRCFSKIKHAHFLGTLKLVHILRGCETQKRAKKELTSTETRNWVPQLIISLFTKHLLCCCGLFVLMLNPQTMLKINLP